MWIKKGLLLNIQDYLNKGFHSHASVPFALHLEGNQFRIFFSSRDARGRSVPYFVDAEINDSRIDLVGEIQGPILNFGDSGTFDDNGIMPSSVVRNGDEIWLYYIGWNPKITVSYHLSIGLAISKDGGRTFSKYSDGPLLDRSADEPYFNSAPFVIKDNDMWRMFYVSCTGWIKHNERPEPLYLVRQSISSDGILWKKPGEIVLGYSEGVESIGRPCVVKLGDNRYEIYYSHRMAREYRENTEMSYKIGSAISEDTSHWIQHKLNIFKDIPLDWDNHMNEYCHVFQFENKLFMLYNGNGFGQQGFGYAVKNLE